ncbi:MAG: alpha/beta fold hydrolase [Cryobacterium sp.]|nr:alpha/beta fold hydrolase [Cryobacterium sp.]
MKDPDDLGAWFDALFEWDAKRAPELGVQFETLRYGDSPDQELDLWSSELDVSELVGSELGSSERRGPVLISIHGGYFLQDYDRSLHNPISRQLAAEGFTVANIEYRRGASGREATLNDIVTALDAAAARTGSNEIAVFGHSAGGYLAAQLATHPKVSLVIPLAPVSDLAEASIEGWDEGGIALWLGGEPSENTDLYAQADLKNQVAGKATRIVIHGTDDTAVAVEQSRRLVEAWREAGVESDYLELPGEGHYGYLDPREPAFKVLRDQLVSWRNTLG